LELVDERGDRGALAHARWALERDAGRLAAGELAERLGQREQLAIPADERVATGHGGRGQLALRRRSLERRQDLALARALGGVAPQQPGAQLDQVCRRPVHDPVDAWRVDRELRRTDLVAAAAVRSPPGEP